MHSTSNNCWACTSRQCDTTLVRHRVTDFICARRGITMPSCLVDADVIAAEEVEAASQSSKGLTADQDQGARDSLASAGADASHCIRTGWEASPWWMAQLRVRNAVHPGVVVLHDSACIARRQQHWQLH